MTKDPAQETARKTAKIIQFPVRLPLPAKPPGGLPRSDARIEIDAGEAWYHEAALLDAAHQELNTRHPA
jgi:hypothetical protein